MRVAANNIDPSGFHREHRHLSPREALAQLHATVQPADAYGIERDLDRAAFYRLRYDLES